MIRIASFGIVPFRKEGETWKVLLILHCKGSHWAFPKGRANPGEVPLESAKRELLEETGLSVETLLLDTPFIEQYQFRRRRDLVVKTVQYFPALVKGELKLQVEEVRDAKWYSLAEALEHLTFKEARHILREMLRQLQIPMPE
ncbi:MAG: NUDIX domain-containing protein [Verrucomicrobia bacterium]|nr:NUDIX domain-containing protein [Verrucomicrobiota bacterium]